jgi:membrane-associated protein
VFSISPDDLLRTGPLLLFGMAVAETAVPMGLMVPAGVALSTGALLAHQGLMRWELVLLASMTGALVGDSFGYWLGRRGGRVFRRMPESLRDVASRAERRTRALFHGHALLAITGGRMVAFVRTLMPATAGASGISYPRFLIFDVPGILAWALLYTGIGVGAAEGARVLIRRELPGALPAAVIVVLLVGAALRTLAVRRRERNEPDDSHSKLPLE